ncbi:TPA: DUF4376 domain-containing protein [Aeromonas hydrophila]
MTLKYSASTGSFYDTRLHGKAIPSDAVDISPEYHAKLLAAAAIVPDERGYPIASAMPTPIRSKSSLLADVEAKRWQVETSGIFVSGIHAATDRESQAQLNNVYTSLKAGLITETSWKDADGGFTMMTLAELEPVAYALAAHVSACFAAEQAHTEAINLLQSQADIDVYDIESGWPANK